VSLVFSLIAPYQTDKYSDFGEGRQIVKRNNLNI